MQHTDSPGEIKRTDTVPPWPPRPWCDLTTRSLATAERKIHEALPLSGPAPSDEIKALLLEDAADLVDLARFAGEIALILGGDSRPRRLSAAPCRCTRCDGCGKIANTDDGEPWSVWLDLPVGSAAAILLGIVRPLTCPACGGTGKAVRS